MGIRRLIRKIVRRWLWVALSILVPVIGSWLAMEHWESLRTIGEPLGTNGESASATIRNIGLVIAGLTALFLALWRGFVAEDQADAAQQSLRNERYQKGADMLGNERLSVRLGGIYALQSLSQEHSREYHIKIMKILSAFIRFPTDDPNHLMELDRKIGENVIREDVQAVLDMIRERSKSQIAIENTAKFIVDLPFANLRYARLANGKLKGAILWKADLSYAILWATDFSGAMLSQANLNEADLKQAILSNADLREAQLRDAELLGTRMNGAKLQKAKLSKAKLWGTDFSGANLNDAILDSAEIWAAKFPGAFLHGTNLSNADFKRTDLSYGKLAKANLSNAKAQGMNLSGANLNGSNLSEADLREANLSTTQFWAANLSNTLLDDANLSGADFSGIRTPTSLSSVIGLTQAQLNSARAYPKTPPKLKGALDAVSGEQLRWHGGQGAPLKQED